MRVNSYGAAPWRALYTAKHPAGSPREHTDMLSLYRAALHGGAPVAAHYFDGVLTYLELDVQSDVLAAWLAGRGVQRGDRLSLFLQNTPQFLIGLVAAWKVGATAVPGNPMYRPEELAKHFADCTPKAVMCHDDHVQAICSGLDAAGQAPLLITTSGHDFQSRDDRRVLSGRRPLHPAAADMMAILADGAGAVPPPIELDGREIGLILYTSGTTGQPKGAMLRHDSMAFNSQLVRDWCGLNQQSSILALAPLFHITGVICHIGAALSARCSLILNYRVEPSLVIETIREHRPTFTIGAITAFNALMHAPGAAADDFASFEAAYSGGAPISPALADEIHRVLGLRIWPSFGMTETTSPTHLCPLGLPPPVDPLTGALSIGVPVHETEAMIVDESGEAVPVGEHGEIWMRGPQIMAGYWNKAQETELALTDGWMRSGDVGFMDEAGWFYVVDRKKDMINASGFKVWPREVEDVLQAHPAVREAAVVGRPDPYRGETVAAFVSLRTGASATAEDLILFCRDRLAAYKCPRSIDLMAELPKTATGKIQRAELRRSEASSST